MLSQQESFLDIQFGCIDYIDLFQKEQFKNCLIYCDPPYKGVKEFKNSKSFDYDLFWQKIRGLSIDNIVIVSELQAPEDFLCIWEKEVSRSIKVSDKSKATEKLFMYRDGKGDKDAQKRKRNS